MVLSQMNVTLRFKFECALRKKRENVLKYKYFRQHPCHKMCIKYIGLEREIESAKLCFYLPVV